MGNREGRAALLEAAIERMTRALATAAEEVIPGLVAERRGDAGKNSTSYGAVRTWCRCGRWVTRSRDSRVALARVVHKSRDESSRAYDLATPEDAILRKLERSLARAIREAGI